MNRTPRRILLVEDNENDALIVREMLASVGADRIEWVSSISAAVYFGESGNIPDVILTDLTLPDSNDWDGLQRILKVFAGVPVIVLTGMDFEHLAAEAIRLGAQDYLVKNSLDPDRLKRALHYAIERNRVNNELGRVNSVLEAMVRTDPLTGLLNRRGLSEKLHDVHEQKKRFEISAYALLIDLDDFKRINDVYGHAVGDAVLVSVGKCLQSSIRETDHVARIGGDEFIVFFMNTREAEVLMVAEKIRRAIAETSVSVGAGRSVQITVSIGATQVSGDMIRLEDLLRRLDTALSLSKREGKNRVALNGVFTSENQKDAPVSVAGLVDALRNPDLFYVLNQPIIRLTDGAVVGYEMLSRLDFPGFEMPFQFLRFAHSQNCLVEVDRLCFEQCWKAAQKIPGPTQIHFNLFPATILTTDLSDWFQKLKPDLFKHEICIEVSEQQFLGDVSYLLDGLRTLRNFGCQIVVDDFGFSHASLESLILLEPESVKIDSSFILGLSASQEKRAKVARMLKVLKTCGVAPIASGVESRLDAEAAKDLGIPEGQGFWFEKPSKPGTVSNG